MGLTANSAAGRIRVDAGDSPSFTGSIAANAGRTGLVGGSIEYALNLTMAPQVVFNPSNTLTLELGGLTAGTQHEAARSP